MDDEFFMKKTNEEKIKQSRVECGTTTRYNYGCRCEPCKGAKYISDAVRKPRRAQPVESTIFWRASRGLVRYGME